MKAKPNKNQGAAITQKAWYKRASTWWIAATGVLTAVATAASNIGGLLDSFRKITFDAPLDLKITDIRVSTKEREMHVILTISKNPLSPGRDCYIFVDKTGTYDYTESDKIQLSSNVQNIRKEFILKKPYEPTEVAVRLACYGAVSNELWVSMNENGDVRPIAGPTKF